MFAEANDVKSKPRVKPRKSAKTKNPTVAIPLVANHNYSIPDAAKAAGVGKISLWRAIYAGHLATYRIGRRRLVSGQQILDWIEAGGKTSKREAKNQ